MKAGVSIMNAIKSVKYFLLLALLATSGIGSVWADRGHGHGSMRFGVIIGPVWNPWYHPSPHYYPSPYYYPPYPPVVIERSPLVYIEQSPPPSAPAAQSAQSGYWYYCNSSKAYYPYVNECPGGWQKVLPQPPSQP